jgi:hypothetical protein
MNRIEKKVRPVVEGEFKDSGEIEALIADMTIPQLRKVWAAACKATGYSSRNMTDRVNGYHDGTPVSITLAALWNVYCDLRIVVPTGRRVMSRAYTSGGRDRVIDETTCCYQDANPAVRECVAAGRK